MKPDRTSYEIWLIDYIDGRLTEDQKKVLFDFLEENPDIKEEAESLFTITAPQDQAEYKGKNDLYRTLSDISDQQFDLICAASVENNLSPEQELELQEMTGENPGRARTLELFRKTKLTAPEVNFRFKSGIRRITIGQRIFRISTVAVSAAAVFLLVFNLVKNPAPADSQGNLGNMTVVTTDNNSGNTDTLPKVQVPVPVKETTPVVSKEKNLLAAIEKNISDEMKGFNEMIGKNDSLQLNRVPIRESVAAISGKTELPAGFETRNETLVAVSLAEIDETYEDYPSVGKFVARVFREKILKTETPEKGNLKAYEVADAGINGLNKLLGWEMQLNKNVDEKGNVKSVNFSSKLLKFNAPVKKSEAAE